MESMIVQLPLIWRPENNICNMASGSLIGQSIFDLVSAGWRTVKVNERPSLRAYKTYVIIEYQHYKSKLSENISLFFCWAYRCIIKWDTECWRGRGCPFVSYPCPCSMYDSFCQCCPNMDVDRLMTPQAFQPSHDLRKPPTQDTLRPGSLTPISSLSGKGAWAATTLV